MISLFLSACHRALTFFGMPFQNFEGLSINCFKKQLIERPSIKHLQAIGDQKLHLHLYARKRA